MVDFFIENKGLAEGKFNSVHGKESTRKKWAELAENLNTIPNGASKTPDQWQVVWRDLKSKTSNKARDLRKARSLTGNKQIDKPPLTDFEKRVVGIVGAEYIKGSNTCVEILPEMEDIQRELVYGNTDVLMEDFIEIQHNTNDDNLDIIEAVDVPQFVFTDTFTESVPGCSSYRAPPAKHNTTPLASLKRSTRTKSIAEQLQSSTLQFQNIAEKQAVALLTIFVGECMNADAMTKIADAVTSLAKTAALEDQPHLCYG